jgi:hypothetical protein
VTDGKMHVPLRDVIAEWFLAALCRPDDDGPLRALVAFARVADHQGRARLAAADRAALGRSGGVFAATPDGVALRDDLTGDVLALRRRAAAFEAALAECRARWGLAPPGAPREPPDEAELAWLLGAAAVLFEHRLFFEVHELLEPAWMRAAGPLRTFLQGIIQVAVALHHRDGGNLRGAVSLLREGVAKLAPFRPSAWGVELAELCAAADRLRSAIESGAAADDHGVRLVVEVVKPARAGPGIPPTRGV